METGTYTHQVAKRPGVTARGYVLVMGSGTEFSEFYGCVFKKMGFTPLAVTAYEAASAYLRLLIFDFVLMDQGSWELAGDALLKDTRKFPQKTPVLVVARRQDLTYRTKALDLGAWDCLLEPISSSEIERVIYGVLHRRQDVVPVQLIAQRPEERCFRA